MRSRLRVRDRSPNLEGRYVVLNKGTWGVLEAEEATHSSGACAKGSLTTTLIDLICCRPKADSQHFLTKAFQAGGPKPGGRVFVIRYLARS